MRFTPRPGAVDIAIVSRFSVPFGCYYLAKAGIPYSDHFAQELIDIEMEFGLSDKQAEKLAIKTYNSEKTYLDPDHPYGGKYMQFTVNHEKIGLALTFDPSNCYNGNPKVVTVFENPRLPQRWEEGTILDGCGLPG